MVVAFVFFAWESNFSSRSKEKGVTFSLIACDVNEQEDGVAEVRTSAQERYCLDTNPANPPYPPPPLPLPTHTRVHAYRRTERALLSKSDS